MSTSENEGPSRKKSLLFSLLAGKIDDVNLDGCRRDIDILLTKSPFGGEQQVLVERVGWNGHFDPFATAGDDRKDGQAQGTRIQLRLCRLSALKLRGSCCQG